MHGGGGVGRKTEQKREQKSLSVDAMAEQGKDHRDMGI